MYVLERDFYPDCWSDDSVMGVLLNTFRPRNLNPAQYDAKMKFWMDLIVKFCDYKGSSDISLNELKEIFTRNGTSPYCLKDVFNKMIEDQNLISKDSFMEVPEKTLSGWAVNTLFRKPLEWGLNKIKEKLIDNEDGDKVFVVKCAAINDARRLQEYVKKHYGFNKIISMEDLLKNIDDMDGLTGEGILIALQQLSVIDRNVYIEVSDDAQTNKYLMKFSKPQSTVEPITIIERSIYNLKHTENLLTKLIDEKEEEINKVIESARECVRNGKKQLAKTHLKKKHLMEQDLIKNIQILENVQAMLHKIHNSKTDKDILNTYKLGSDAIKSAFAGEGINLDKVDDIIEDMREVLQDQEDIKTLISDPFGSSNSTDDSDLERELLELIGSDDNDQNGNNKGTTVPLPETKTPQEIDDDLEERLRKLRTDFSPLEENDIAAIKS